MSSRLLSWPIYCGVWGDVAGPLVCGHVSPLRSGPFALRLRAEAGGSSRRPRHFSLSRQRKVPQRKATRSQGHFVVPCAARARGVPAKLAALKQTRGLIPLALRCSALPHGASGYGIGRACGGLRLPLRSDRSALWLKGRGRDCGPAAASLSLLRQRK